MQASPPFPETDRVLHGDFIVQARLQAPEAAWSLTAGDTAWLTWRFGDGAWHLGWRSGLHASWQTLQAGPAGRGAVTLQIERQGSSLIASWAASGQLWQSERLSGLDWPERIRAGIEGASAACDNLRFIQPLDRSRSLYEQATVCSRLELLDLASGARRVIHEAPKLFEAPNWSRCGRFLVFNQEGRLWRLTLVTGQIEALDTGEVVRNNNDHVLSFDGQGLAMSSADPQDGHSRIHVASLAGGPVRQVTAQGPSYLHGWSPDGRHLAFVGRRPGHDHFNLYRIHVDGREETRLTFTQALDDGPEYSPDGQWLYFNSARTGRMRLWRMPASGGAATQLTDDGLDDWFPHVSPDGQTLAFISYLPGEVQPQDHPGGRHVVLRKMPAHGGPAEVLAYVYGGQGTLNVHSWSPDGRQLAFVSYSRPLTAV